MLHPILDVPDGLFHVKPCAVELCLLLTKVVKLLLNLRLQLELLSEMRHLHVDVQIFQAL